MKPFSALVIGASGGFGGAIARELIARGHPVRLGSRAGRGVDLPGEQVAVDALDAAAVQRAANGVEVIVYGFSVPYPQWRTRGIEAARITAGVAADSGACVLFPGNVYGLGPDFSAPLSEEASAASSSRKGAIRNQIEAMFQHATRARARVLVVRAGDFFGPHCPQSWFTQMTQGLRAGGPIVRLGPPNVPHTWAYLPDVAAACVDLLERREQLAPFDVFHFAGHAVDNDTMTAALKRVLGDPERRIRDMPWWLLRLAAPFVPMAREAHELRYLWTEPLRLDDRKLRSVLPDLRFTPLDQALRASLQLPS